MPLAIIVSPRAHQDIDDCAAFISKDNLDAALRFLDAYNSALELLIEYPRIGSRFPVEGFENLDIRYILVPGFERYLVFYALQDDAIRVYRVIHSSREYDPELE